MKYVILFIVEVYILWALSCLAINGTIYLLNKFRKGDKNA